jgi:hypothetical protein
MSAYYRFPEYRLASGRYILIEMFTQDVSSGIAAPYTDAGGRVDLAVNPWIQGGVPMAKSIAQPVVGYIGVDACEFEFAGIPVYGTKCLYCLIMEQPPDQFVWNIRYYTKPNASASYPLRPQFWGIVERAVQYGEILSLTRHELNTYKLVARNRLALLDLVEISSWSIPWKTTLALSPAHVYIDGEELHKIYFTTGDDRAEFINPTDMRFLNLRDMFETMAANIALTTTINRIDSVLSSWTFYGKDGAGVESEYTFDELVIASGVDLVSHPLFGTDWYWHWSYFDHEKRGDYTVYAVGSLLQLLKQFLPPFGLTAQIDVWNRTGESYLSIHEVESRAGVVLRHLLREKSLETGENSTNGFTANVANDGETTFNSTSGEQLDVCFMSATRIRAGERWIQGGAYPRDTDDLLCLFGSLYIYDATGNFVTNVTKITVRNDGRAPTTVSPASVSLHNGGKMIGEATCRYYFNPQSLDVSRLGYYRREMQQLECRDHEIRDDISGTCTSIVANKLVSTGAFTADEDTYLYRRVRHESSGAIAVITARDSADALSLDADIMLFVSDPFVILGPSVGDFAELPDGHRWRIAEMTVNDRENTTDFLLETEAYFA